jgi:energy-coupling factor transporter ATP-binding protein EcfA2
LKEKLKTDSPMTIAEIKAALPISTVLAHYGLAAGPTGSLACPFHDDKQASMKVYADTNTAYCFAGGCAVQSVDVIDFVLHMERVDKRTAILRAKELCGQPLTTPVTIPEPVTPALDIETIYTSARAALEKHRAARAYCEGRALRFWALIGIGYKSRRTPDKWGRGCIVFPLRDRANFPVSLYGRAIKGAGHYYTAGRRGLYPNYPKPETQTLLLTESVIDAATLEYYTLSVDGLALLALYGTNGLTAEHRTAIAELPHLREIILALDNDAAGRAASDRLTAELHALYPRLAITRLPLPEDRDVNQVAVAAGTDLVARFEELLAGREVLVQPSEPAPASPPAPTLTTTASTFDTSNPYDLLYTTATASYQVRGGVRLADKDLDSLKITLLITNGAGRKSRQKLDLYEDRQVSRAARSVAERLGLRADLVELDLDGLTEALDDHRERLRAEHQDGRDSQEQTVAVTGQARASCEAFLKQPQLLERINEQIGKAGLVGEEGSRLLLFVVASSYAMPQTLHALIQGASGSGKTRLARVVSELMPEEVVKRYTRVTDGSFYNQAEHYFSHKLLCFEDIDGLKEEALLAVRELQSNEILITSTSFKDELGNIRGAERVVRGPIASLSCTTRAEVYEDNVSRCFVVAVDESSEQSRRVIDYQNRRSAGKIEARQERAARELLRNCLRLLRPLEVINPYADRIRLPEEAHKLRRLNELYQSFVRQVTLLNQFQRKRDERGRLITEVADLRLACEVLFESIVLKVDELDGSLRQFFESLKAYVLTKGKDYEFTRFEVRKATGVSKTQQHRYLSRLVDWEYVRQNGFANRGYRYRIAHWDDQGALRQRIRSRLTEQIEDLDGGDQTPQV